MTFTFLKFSLKLRPSFNPKNRPLKKENKLILQTELFEMASCLLPKALHLCQPTKRHPNPSLDQNIKITNTV